MIGATTSALLNQPIWAYLVWGLPGAIVVATVWAHFSMDRTIAEVRFQAGQAALRSVYDVLRDRTSGWKPIFDVRTTSWHVELSIGRATHEFRPEHWSNYDAFRKAALRAFQSEPQRPSSAA